MKKLIVSISVGMCFLFSTSAFALTMADVSVGSAGAPDILLGSGYVSPSNPETELAFFSEVLGPDVDVSDWNLRKYDFGAIGYDGWSQLTDSPVGTNLWAFDFGLNYRPEYFLIKTGNIRGATFNNFIYENVGSLQYAVIDLAALGDGITINKIAHLTAPNPEPSTLLLLGAGILGLAIYRRKKT